LKILEKVTGRTGFFPILLAAICLSGTDVLMKSGSSILQTGQVLFFRFSLGIILIGILRFIRHEGFICTNIKILILRSISEVLGFFFLYKAISSTSLSNAIVLFYTFPLFSVLFSVILYRVKPVSVEIFSVVIGFIGVIIILYTNSFLMEIGNIYSLLAGLFVGLSMVLLKELRRENDSFIIYFYFCLTGLILFFPFYIGTFRDISIHRISYLIPIGVLFLFAHSLMNYGLKFCSAPSGSAILMSEVVFTGLLSLFLFKETFSTSFVLGAMLILCSLFMNSLPNILFLKNKTQIKGGD